MKGVTTGNFWNKRGTGFLPEMNTMAPSPVRVSSKNKQNKYGCVTKKKSTHLDVTIGNELQTESTSW